MSLLVVSKNTFPEIKNLSDIKIEYTSRNIDVSIGESSNDYIWGEESDYNNNRKFRSLRKPLKEIENEMEPIDFSELQNVKDIDKRRKVCPKCNGSGFVFLN